MKFKIELFRENEITPHRVTVIYAPHMQAAEKTADKMRIAYQCASCKVTEQ